MSEHTEQEVPPIVAVEGLVKVFRDFWGRAKVRALDGIDFAAGEGEIFGLLGPNGSGKSTTIKILLDLLHPSDGRVRVFGRAPGSTVIKRDIGYLPEESHAYSYLTPRETLHFYGKLFDLSRHERYRRVEELLEMVGLTEAADRPVGEFSKGMTRRIGLAQALINDPRLVILDEPTSGLDPLGCRQVKDLMLALARRGKTILLTSHLLADVEDVCDRIAILYNGRIHAAGRVRELLESQDRLQLTMPALEPEAVRTVLELLRERVGEDLNVAHPSMDLEQFFLNVVREANQATGGHADAGAAALAPFLATGAATVGGRRR